MTFENFVTSPRELDLFYHDYWKFNSSRKALALYLTMAGYIMNAWVHM